MMATCRYGKHFSGLPCTLRQASPDRVPDSQKVEDREDQPSNVTPPRLKIWFKWLLPKECSDFTHTLALMESSHDNTPEVPRLGLRCRLQRLPSGLMRAYLAYYL